MKVLSTGSKEDTLPELKSHQCLFVDIWGNWKLYEDYYLGFQARVDRYVESCKYSCDYFNSNYIREYKSKSV